GGPGEVPLPGLDEEVGLFVGPQPVKRERSVVGTDGRIALTGIGRNDLRAAEQRTAQVEALQAALVRDLDRLDAGGVVQQGAVMAVDGVGVSGMAQPGAETGRQQAALLQPLDLRTKTLHGVSQSSVPFGG